MAHTQDYLTSTNTHTLTQSPTPLNAYLLPHHSEQYNTQQTPIPKSRNPTMAAATAPFFFFFLLFLLPAAVFSVSEYFQILHVSTASSFQKPRQILSTSNSSFSLHPRAALTGAHRKDYAGLTESRLARDTSRVDSINSKLEFKLSRYTQSDMEPVRGPEIRPEEYQSPLTSGTRQGSGEYFARIGVGQPAKQFFMVIDTGSDLSWLQCEPCNECYQQSDPIFRPAQSSTYRPVSCSSQECSSLEVSACNSGSCLYQVSYGDGSYTVGMLVKETVSFGRSGSVANVPIGCGHDNEGLFIGSAGIIGLGRAPLAFPSQIRATSFSYCLVDRDSDAASTLEFNSAPPPDSVIAAMVRNPRTDLFYYVDLVGMSVGGARIPIPESVFQVDGSGRGGIIVDSGTAVTRLQAQAYQALRDAFARGSSSLPSSSAFALFDTCYDLSGMTQVKVPTIAFLFAGGRALSLPPENYLIPVNDQKKYCLAFASTSGSLSIIGNVQQQGTRVTFDLGRRVIGFSPNKC